MKTAIMTASYAGDFDRCVLLCESVDRFVTGDWHHYLLVERGDVALFRALEGPRRTVVSEAELFPFWLRSISDPFARGRRVWLSPFLPPLRGWHAQQLRRLAMARHVRDADALLSIDSDVVVVRPFCLDDLWRDDRLMLFRAVGEAASARAGHMAWLAHAGDLLGLPRRPAAANDYITTMVPWRVDTTCALLDHIERRAGTSWIRAVAASRAISECMIYGRFVDEILGGEGHWATDRRLAHVLWFREDFPETPEGLAAFAAGIAPDQIAIGVQSFVAHPVSDIRRIAETVSIPARDQIARCAGERRAE